MQSIYRGNAISTGFRCTITPRTAHRRSSRSSSSVHVIQSASDDSAQRLVDWVLKENGTVNGVKIHRFNGADGASGYGLQAKEPVAQGTALITIPPSCQLSYNQSTIDPRLLNLIDKVPKELWGAKLALQLLSHRLHGKDDHFSPYLESLPVGFPGVPLFFSPDAVKSLSYPPVTSQIARRCRWILDFAETSIAPLKNTPDDPFHGLVVDANLLGWALAAVTSRAFRIGGMDRPATMLPLMDMANHSFRPNAKIVLASRSATSSTTGRRGDENTPRGSSESNRGGLSMVALRDIQPDEPILISYGALPNDFLLLDYGFIIPDNPYDTVQLRFDKMLIEAGKAVANVGLILDTNTDGQDAVEALPVWQAEALSSVGLYGQTANTEVNVVNHNTYHHDETTPFVASAAAQSTKTLNPLQSTCPVDARFLAGTRVLCAAHTTELQNKKGIDALGSWQDPLSQRNEVATLQTLTGVCAVALSQFPGTIDDDRAMLISGIDPSTGNRLSEEVQLAVRFRLEKKRLLTSALGVLSTRVQQVKEGGGNLSHYVQSRRNNESKPSSSTKKGFGK